MKVLLNDGMVEGGLEVFREAGIEIDTEKKDLEALISHIGEYDALVVRSATKITKDIRKAGSSGKLKIIGRAGVGVDNIDVKTASNYGILVKYAPSGNTNAAAELTLALMQAISRNIPQAHLSLMSGVWEKKQFKGHELSYKTLGIFGCC